MLSFECSKIYLMKAFTPYLVQMSVRPSFFINWIICVILVYNQVVQIPTIQFSLKTFYWNLQNLDSMRFFAYHSDFIRELP